MSKFYEDYGRLRRNVEYLDETQGEKEAKEVVQRLYPLNEEPPQKCSSVQQLVEDTSKVYSEQVEERFAALVEQEEQQAFTKQQQLKDLEQVSEDCPKVFAASLLDQ